MAELSEQVGGCCRSVGNSRITPHGHLLPQQPSTPHEEQHVPLRKPDEAAGPLSFSRRALRGDGGTAPIGLGGVVRAGGTVASPLGSQRSAHGTTHLHSRPTPSWHRGIEGAGRNRASSFSLCRDRLLDGGRKGRAGTNPPCRSCQNRWAAAPVPWATGSMTDPTGHHPAAVHPQRDIDALRAPGEAPSFFLSPGWRP